MHIQPDNNRKIRLLYRLIYLVIRHPIRIYNFTRLELIAGRSWSEVVRNIVINTHILDKHLDWLHFGFATMGIGRENVAKAINARSAISFRGYDIGLYPHQHPNCYSLLWERIEKVHTISDELYEKALSLGLHPDIPVQKITPAIDINFFFSKKILKLHDPIRLLSVGRLTWKKGFEYSLMALDLLKKEGIDFEYRIVGDGDYREAIIFAMHQLQLTDHVKLKGQLSQGEVKEEMEWADIYIQPSIQEGFCNAVLEAQAMGLLCIVTDAEGLSENVFDRKTGWVVNKRSPEKIVSEIKVVKEMDYNQLNKIKKNAIQRVRNNFNLSKQINKWVGFYKY